MKREPSGNAYELLIGVDIERIFSHSGSIILSAVYSYEAARLDDHMVEVVKMSIDILKELKPLPTAIFNLFPSRGPPNSLHSAASYRLT